MRLNRWDSGQRRWQKSWAAAPAAAGQLYPCRRHGGPDGAAIRWAACGQQQRHDGTWQAGRRWAACAWRRFRGGAAGDAAAVALGYDDQLHGSRRASTAAGDVALPAAGRRDRLAAAPRPDGRYVIVAATSAGALYYAPTAGRQGQGARVAGLAARAGAGGAELAAIRDHERRVELYFRQRGDNHLIRLVEAGDTSDTNMDWSEPADLGVPYIRPAVGVDARGNVMLAILERPVARSGWSTRQAGELDALAASPPAMSVIGDTVYIVARAAGAPQLPGAVAPRGGAWAANLTLDGVPASGGGAQGRGGAAGRPAQSGRGRAEPCGGAAPFAGPPRHAGRRAHAQPGLAHGRTRTN